MIRRWWRNKLAMKEKARKRMFYGELNNINPKS